VKFLRTLSTSRLLIILATIALLAGGGAAIAVAAARANGPTPDPKPLAQAMRDALVAPEPEGITARIKFTNTLFPSGSLIGKVGSALMSGASGRLWMTNDGRGRLELQSEAGDVQIVWHGTTVTVYDASSNTVYRARPPDRSESWANHDRGAAPSITRISDFLSKLTTRASVSEAEPTDVAGRPAYRVTIAPKHDGGLLGSAQLAWDAVRGVPLRVAIYAPSSSSPVLELAVTDISYGPVASSDVVVSPPPGAKTIDLGAFAGARPPEPASQVSGLQAVEAAVGFRVAAPDSLVGLPRRDVRLVGGADSRAALVVYGHDLGAILIVERKAHLAAPHSGGLLSSLPPVSLDGHTGHELATQLGTVIEWQRDGIAYVLAGSLPPAAAEAAARALK
jgi:outer membrane lipoprotein-sorting protein